MAARLASVALPSSNLPRPAIHVEKIIGRGAKIPIHNVADAPLHGARGLAAGPAPRSDI